MSQPSELPPPEPHNGSGLDPNRAAVPSDTFRPEELPMVEPPSASYIVQLFLIPALIVAAVIGVWVLFGKLADSETDWQQLTTELGSTNEHRRWRAANGLAQILRNQQIAPNENGLRLADQPEVAKALSELLQESLKSTIDTDEEIKHQEFLTRTLGSLNVDDVVVPVLADAMSAERHVDVRKSSLMAMAMIAGRHFEAQAGSQNSPSEDGTGDVIIQLEQPFAEPTIQDENALKQLDLAAQDEDASIRHLAAFVLGMVSGADAIETLKVMLLDADSLAQANAAVALVRNGQIDGIATLTRLIAEGAKNVSREDFQKLSPQEQQSVLQKRQFEEPIILKNCIRAIDAVWDRIPADNQAQLRSLLEEISKDYAAADIRIQAQTLLRDHKP